MKVLGAPTPERSAWGLLWSMRPVRAVCGGLGRPAINNVCVCGGGRTCYAELAFQTHLNMKELVSISVCSYKGPKLQSPYSMTVFSVDFPGVSL